MEYDILDEKTINTGGLSLSEEGKNHLNNGRSWALFLAIMGYISMGIMFIVAIFMFVAGSFMGNRLGMPSGVLGLVYLVLAAVYVVPLIYLTKFIRQAGVACKQNDNGAFNFAIKNLRMLFKSMGILTIVLIATYFVAIFVMIGLGATNLFG